MPRTGTTFLQQDIFPHLENVNLVNFRHHGGILFKMMSIKKINTLFENIENLTEEIVQKKLKPYMIKDKINLISDENIYDNIWIIDDKRWQRINKLKNCFSDAKIIFGIREKKSLLSSIYRKYVMDGGILSFDEFKQSFNIRKLDYEEYIDYLFKLFGRENVYIYKFEQMKNDIDSFVEGICSFLNVKPPKFENIRRNIGYSKNQVKIALLLNRFFKTEHNPRGIVYWPYEWMPHRLAFTFFNDIVRQKRGKKG